MDKKKKPIKLYHYPKPKITPAQRQEIMLALGKYMETQQIGISIKKGELLKYFDKHPDVLQAALNGEYVYISGKLMKKTSREYSILKITHTMQSVQDRFETTLKVRRKFAIASVVKKAWKLKTRPEDPVKLKVPVGPPSAPDFQQRDGESNDWKKLNLLLFGENGKPDLQIDSTTEAHFVEYMNVRDKESFSELLKKYMKEKSITVAKLAERAGVSDKTIQRMRNRDDYKPKPMTLVVICVGLQLSPLKSEQLFQICGYQFSNSEEDRAYSFVINNLYYYSIPAINKFLTKYGIPNLKFAG